MKISSNRVLNACITVVALLLMAGCEEEALTDLRPPRSVLTVETVSPAKAFWPQTLKANGEINAWQKASISSEIANLKLLEILADVGDKVEKGQVLARFDTASVKLDVEQAKASLLEAEANLLYAQKQAERNIKLNQKGTVSDDALLQSEVNAKSAKAKLISAQANLDYQQFRLERAIVTAPDDGVISARNAQIGSVYTPGTELFELIRQNRYEWLAELSETQFKRVEVGQNVTLILDSGHQIKGTVNRKAPLVDKSTLTATVYVTLPQDPNILGGNFASGNIELPPKEVTYLPESSIVYRDGYTFVMAVVENAIQPIRVVTGQRHSKFVEIFTTLNSTTMFVKSGGAFLVNGDKVEVSSQPNTSTQGE
ncbi:efflux RND transporter periplasmic adaptor subunit [Aestuariibacter sp. GS-14]|uniref:efflux RND transporter periplasmic adaptor subunit n=1 Tax=Aestuariibacter sp. GS-14 TaxID=2590670 RepID=UPI001125EFEE|nr:efflux RND transporter periplasmic adaptor subunit [Aestuariibacter sp. GS-14]TPV59973.1 efflux RND transporter periplasmic adaptor subunit [Aestuariibacter sp. GS-14]